MSNNRMGQPRAVSGRRATTTSAVEARRLERLAEERIQAENEKLWAAMGLKVVRR